MRKIIISLTVIIMLVLSVLGLNMLQKNNENKFNNTDISNNSDLPNNSGVLVECKEHKDLDKNLVCDNCEDPVFLENLMKNQEIKSDVESGKETLTVSGRMPENTKAEFEKINKEEAVNLAKEHIKDIKEEEVLFAYDISLNVNETKYQPKQHNNQVKVKLSELNLDTSKTYALLHIKENGEKELIPAKVLNANELEFKATSFSVYIVITVESKSVTFEGENYTIKDTEGNVIENDAQIASGTNFSFVVEPADGYAIDEITCVNSSNENVIEVTEMGASKSAVIAEVSENLTINVVTVEQVQTLVEGTSYLMTREQYEMSDTNGGTVYGSEYMLGAHRAGQTDEKYLAYTSDLVKTITIVDNLDIPSDAESWDVSSAKDGSIMAWIIPNTTDTTMYDMYIGSNNNIKINTYGGQTLFMNYTNCTSINNLNLIDTSEATSMSGMFRYCYKLQTLDVSSFATDNVTNMSFMFRHCEMLKNIDVTKFNTEKVTDMYNMFGACKSLTKLDVTGFDTSKVTNMSYMFADCETLTTLDVTGFDTSNVTNMTSMFNGCNKLSTLDVSNFDTSKVTNMSYMFANCQAVTTLDVSGFDTSNVTDMQYMFAYCYKVKELDVSNFDTSKVTNMDRMFRGCSSITELDLSNFDTSKVTNMDSMFKGDTELEDLDLSTFDTSKLTNMNNMFSDCSNLETLILGENFTKLNGATMFKNTSALKRIIAYNEEPMTLVASTGVSDSTTLYTPNIVANTAYESSDNYASTFSNGDKVTPMVDLLGDNPQYIYCGTTYTNPGIKVLGFAETESASWEAMGYTLDVTGTDVDTSTPGTRYINYSLKYAAPVAAGETPNTPVEVGTAQREVIVTGNYSVNGVHYMTLLEAYNSISTSEQTTIKVEHDNIDDSYTVIAETRNIVLDLNGKVITVSSIGDDNTPTLIANIGTLELKDTVGNGKITMTITEETGSRSLIINDGTLTVTSGTYETVNSTAYEVIFQTVNKESKIIVNGGTIKSLNTGSNGAVGIYVYIGTIEVNGGTIITSNEAAYGAACIRSNAQREIVVNINGGSLESTYVPIVVEESTTEQTNMAINISGNADLYGTRYGIRLTDYSGTLNVTGGTITGTSTGIYSTTQYVSNVANTITIGTQGGEVSTTVPTITGDSYGLRLLTPSSTLNFYDGVVKTKTTLLDVQSTQNLETGYEFVNGTDGEYKTAYLKKTPTLTPNVTSASMIVGNTQTINLTVVGDGNLNAITDKATVAVVAKNGNTLTVTGVSVGTAVLTVTLEEGTEYAGRSLVIPVTVSAKSINPAVSTDLTISLSQTEYNYNGEAKTPGVTINDSTRKYNLVEGTDFTVAYSDNTNAGTATVTITGTGNYTDKATVTFTINPGTITGSVTIKANSLTYGGKGSISNITVTPNDATLTYQWFATSSNSASGGSSVGTSNSLSFTANSFEKYVYLVVTATADNYNTQTITSNVIGPIAARPITVTSGSDSKTYDGSALTNNTYTVIDEVDGDSKLPISSHSVTPTITGTITKAGSTENTMTVLVKNTSGTNVSKYYNITTVLGTLTVNKATPTITVTPSTLEIPNGDTATSTVTYDGDGELSVSSNKENVATATISGNTVTVNAVGGGNAVITVNAQAGTNYEAAYARISVSAGKGTSTLMEREQYTVQDSDGNDKKGSEHMIGAYRAGQVDSTYLDYTSDLVKTITITDSISIPSGAPNWDVSKDEDGSIMAWIVPNSTDTTMYDLYIGSNNNIKAPAGSNGLFSRYTNCTTINGLDLLDTSEATTMSGMFYYCYKLESLDLSSWVTDNVKAMDTMFRHCESLETLKISNFNTSNVTSMTWMFGECKKLTTVDVSKFNTSKVTDMYGMFENCNMLESIDVSNFNTSNVTNMGHMFWNCYVLNTLNVTNFNTSKVTKMNSMFAYCRKLTAIDVSNFDTSKTTSINAMFDHCENLTAVDVSGFDTTNVTDMSYLFTLCEKLTSIDVSNFNTSKVTNMDRMFRGCSIITELDLSNFDTTNVTNMDSMFKGDSGLEDLDLSTFDTSKITNMNNMFSDCSNLETLILGKNFNKLNGATMFKNTSSLKRIVAFNETPMTLAASTGVSAATTLYTPNVTSEVAYEGSANYASTFSNGDKVTPMVELLGDNPQYIYCGTTYTNPGVKVLGFAETESASWEAMGYTLDVTGADVDTSTPGTKYINYSFKYAAPVAAGETPNTPVEVGTAQREIVVMDETKALITEWTIPANADSDGAGTTITLPIAANTVNNYIVDWGDGVVEAFDNIADFPTHEYTNTTSTTYTIKIVGKVERFGCTDWTAPTSDSNYYTFIQYLTGLKAWGEIEASSYGFAHCTNLAGAVPAATETTFINVNEFNSAFLNCKKLTSLPENLFTSASKAVSFNNTFNGCSSLTALPETLFNGATNAQGFYGTFQGCLGLTEIPKGLFSNNTQATNFALTFSGCTSLTQIPEDLFVNNINVVSFESTFNGCTGITSIPAKLFINNTKVKQFNATFYGCRGLTGYLPKELLANTKEVTMFNGMFNGCVNLVGGELSIDTSNNPDLSTMFSNCPKLTTLVFGEDFKNINGSGMFSGSNNLKALILLNNATATSEVGTLGTLSTIGLADTTTIYVSTEEVEAVYESAWTGIIDATRVEPILELYGDESIVIGKNGTYDESATVAGYKSITGTDMTPTEMKPFGYELTQTLNNVDLTTAGDYQVTYTLTLDGTEVDSVTRNVKVVMPVLMPETYENSNTNNKVLGYDRYTGNFDLASIKRENILTITLLDTSADTIPVTHVASWDVSKDSNGSVTAWLVQDTTDTTKYHLYIGGNGGIIASEGSYLFANYMSCTAINNLNKLDTSKVTSMNSMFINDMKLTSLDVSKFVTDNVNSMSYMFCNSNSLTSLDITNFKTSNLKDASNMFYSCKKLTTIDLTKFDTSNVTNMFGMFRDCNELTNLDVSKFDTSKVTEIRNMFNGCKKLTALDVSNFNTSKVTSFNGMFQECNNLKTADVSGFDTTNAKTMVNMFYGCNSLEIIDVKNFNTSNVTDMTYMFGRCKSVKELDVSGFNTANVTSLKGMFQDCNTVITLDVNGFDTTKVTNFSCMFQNCTNLTSLDVTNFDTSKAKEMVFMFENCSALKSLNLNSFDTSGLDGSNSGYSFAINGGNVLAINVDSLITGCSNLETIFLGAKFGRIDGRYMFKGVSNLKAIITTTSSPLQVLNDDGEFGDNRLSTITAVIYVPTEAVETLYEADSNYASMLSFTAGQDSAKIEPILGVYGDNPTVVGLGGTYDESATVAGYKSTTDTDITPAEIKEFGYALTQTSNNVDLTNAGDYQVTYKLTLDGTDVDTVTRDVTVEPKDLSSATVTLNPTENIYNGQEIKPEVSVTLNGELLENETDYTVSYSNNIEVGTATVTITGIGNYTGAAIQNFTISPAEPDIEIVVDTTGPEITNIVATVTENNITITADIEDPEAEPGVPGSGVNENSIRYAVTESDSAPAEDSDVWLESNVITVPRIKIGYIWVKAEDNVGNVSISTELVSVKLITSITGLDIVINEPTEYEYNGKEHKPTVTVKENGVALAQGTDYTVTYKNNINVGTDTEKPTVIITGTGLYEGTVEKTFTITKKAVTVTASAQTITFGNTILTGANYATLTDAVSGHALSAVTLTAGRTAVGTGTITPSAAIIKNGTTDVTANYDITYKTGVLTIEAKDISSATIGLNPTEYDYTGEEIKPTVSVGLNSKALVNGTDYTVSYSNNINVGTATVTIIGIGNYTGTASKTFTIKSVDLTVNASNYTGNYDGKAHGITINVSGVTDVSDAVISYGTTAGTYDKNVAPTYTNVGEYTVYFKVEKDNYNTYTGSAKVTIKAKSLAVVWTNVELTYNGSAQKPTATVTTGVNGESITLTVTGEQTNVGNSYTATVSDYAVTGGQADKDNYVLTNTTTNFKILAVTGVALNVTLPNATYTYNGTAHKPVPTVRVGNAELKAGTDYEVIYGENTNVGTGTVTIKGIGNYAGNEKTVNFTIDKKVLTVVANAQTKVYGSADPTLTYTVSGNVSGETPKFSGVLVRATGEGIGTYAINVGTLALADNGTFKANNYSLAYTGANLTITTKSIADLAVTLNPSTFEYDGTAKEPSAQIVFNSKDLVAKTDYEITYKNNINTGIATATITGKGNFSGSKDVTFTITQKTPELKVNPSSLTILKGHNASSTITYNGDGEISVVSNDTSVATVSVVNSMVVVNAIKEGTTTITVTATGEGNYKAATATINVTVSIGNYSVNDVHYSTLAEAYDSITGTTGTIIVEKSNTDNTAVTIAEDKDIVIDLNGKTITVDNIIGTFITNNGTLEMKDRVGNGKIDMSYTGDNWAVYLINNTGELEITNGIYQYNASNSYPSTINSTGIVTINGGTINAEKTTDGWITGIHVQSGTLNMNAGNINVIGPTNGNSSGIVNNGQYTATINVNGGTIHATTYGIRISQDLGDGAINTSTLNISGTAKVEGGTGIYLRDFGGNINITGGSINGILSEEFLHSNLSPVITIGEKGGNVSTLVPEIIGMESAIELNSNEIFNFYDGILKGKTSGIEANTTVADIETGYKVVTGTETINGATYQTAYLKQSTMLVADPEEVILLLENSATVELTYNGDGKLSVVSDNSTIASAELASNVITVKGLKIGKTTLTVTASEGNTFAPATITIPVTVIANNLEGDINLSQDVFEYDSKEHKPTVTFITKDGVRLTENVDFTVRYENNIDVGTATVIVTGIGNYGGELRKTFTITKGYLKVTLKDKQVMYTGNEVASDEAIIEYAYEDLKDKVVYKYYLDYPLEQEMTSLPVDVGIYYVQAVLVGMQNYNDIESNRARIVIYGAPTAPSITAKDSDKVLENGSIIPNEAEIFVYGSSVQNVNNVEFGYKYSLDETTWNEYTDSFKLTSEGKTTIYAKAYLKENPSLESAVVTYEITIDKTAPKIDDVVVEDKVDTVVIDVEINGDEIKEVFVTEDPTVDPSKEEFDDDWQEVGEDNKVITELSQGDGKKTIYVWAKDAAGNIVGPVQKTITLSALKIGNQNDNNTTIMFKVTDKYLHTANITAGNLAIYVNDVLNSGKVTTLAKEEITDGYKFTAIMEDVTGDGKVSFGVLDSEAYDKAGNELNILNSITATNEITVDNTLPQMNITTTENKITITASDENMKAIMLNGKVLGRNNGTYQGELKDGLNKVVVIDEYGNEVVEEVTYEVIDVKTESVPNRPILLDGMKAVYWDGATEIEANTFTSEMYGYSRTESGVENTTSKWANAKTIEDESYWVWIPRFAYKTTYYTNSTKTVISETETDFRDFDVIFLKDVTNEYLDTLGETNSLPEGYVVADAFTSNSNNGGWGKALEGIWVSKYEMSREDSSDNYTWIATTNALGGSNVVTTNAGNQDEYVRVVSKPNVTSWTGIDVSTAYINALNMNENAGSHLMKNSEWEATFILAESEYGRNGNFIDLDTEAKTGGALGTTTTGNITGVFDMLGGSWEYTATYIPNNALQQYASNLVNETKAGYKQTITNSDVENLILSDVEETVFEKTMLENPYETSFIIYRGGDVNAADLSVESIPYAGTPDSRVGYRAVLVNN